MYCVATPASMHSEMTMASQPLTPTTTHTPTAMSAARCPTEMQFYTPSSTNLFVRYLPREVDDNRLREIFSVYGAITSSMVMRDIHSGRSLGTAFVRFSQHHEAFRALCEAHGMPLFGKSISVQWAKQQHDVTPAGQDRLKMNKLFLRNVPMELTEQDLAALVAPYGTVEKVTLHNDTAPIMDVTAPRRIVFVTFAEEGAAERALRAVHNSCPFAQCCGVPLMCKLINDAIKSKKHRVRSDSTGNQSIESATTAAAAATNTSETGAAMELQAPAGTVTRAVDRLGGLRKLSLESLHTCQSSPFVSGGDESSTTTPSRSCAASVWDVAPTACTPVAAFTGPLARPAVSPCSTSSHRGSVGEASHSSRFCHNPYSMNSGKVFV